MKKFFSEKIEVHLWVYIVLIIGALLDIVEYWF